MPTSWHEDVQPTAEVDPDPLAVSWPHWSAGDEPRPPADDADTQTIPVVGDGSGWGRHDFDTPIATQTSLDLGAPVAAGSAPTVDDLHADFSARASDWPADEQEPVGSHVPWYAESDDEQPSWTPNGFGQR